MSLDSAFGDEKRTRMGLGFLVAGTLLVVWAWGSWVFRTTETPEVAGGFVDSGEPGEATGGGRSAVVVGLAALAGLAFVGYLLLRRSRRSSARRDELLVSSDGSNDQRLSRDARQDSG
ncbi:MAG: hypothetical protein IID42_13995 [Planctomycetes bacterium]|nr:hypothetical protein [Planctomycetota bacterium]